MRIQLPNRYKRVKLSDRRVELKTNITRVRTKLDVDVSTPAPEGIFDYTFDATFN